MGQEQYMDPDKQVHGVSTVEFEHDMRDSCFSNDSLRFSCNQTDLQNFVHISSHIFDELPVLHCSAIVHVQRQPHVFKILDVDFQHLKRPGNLTLHQEAVVVAVEVIERLQGIPRNVSNPSLRDTQTKSQSPGPLTALGVRKFFRSSLRKLTTMLW